MARPKVNSEGQKELDKANERLDAFESEVKSMTMDRMSQAPKEESEPQTKLSSRELNSAPEIYLKPVRTIDPPMNAKKGIQEDVFNEKFREEYEYQKKYVRFIAENHEIIGEVITLWTRPYPGIQAQMWEVPANKAVWGPRYLAEQIKRKCYHRLVMNDHKVVESGTAGTIVGGIIASNTVQRLDAKPAPNSQISFNRKVSNF